MAGFVVMLCQQIDRLLGVWHLQDFFFGSGGVRCPDLSYPDDVPPPHTAIGMIERPWLTIPRKLRVGEERATPSLDGGAPADRIPKPVGY
jgi:hypothetical protein